jgi:hypothetical protein
MYVRHQLTIRASCIGDGSRATGRQTCHCPCSRRMIMALWTIIMILALNYEFHGRIMEFTAKGKSSFCPTNTEASDMISTDHVPVRLGVQPRYARETAHHLRALLKIPNRQGVMCQPLGQGQHVQCERRKKPRTHITPPNDSRIRVRPEEL